MQIDDIAAKLKVSASTVSRALNPAKQHLISPSVREKIRKYAAKHGFTPNQTARELLTGKTHNIGVILPTTFESFFFNDHLDKSLAGVYKVLEEQREYGCKLIVIPKGSQRMDLDQQIRDSRVDGLLVSSLWDIGIHESRFIPESFLSKWTKPVVVMGLEPKEKSRFSSLYSSNVKAARQAVSYLIRKGHKKIAMVHQAPVVTDSRDRMEGYKLAFKDHHLKMDPSLIIETEVNLEEERALHPPSLQTDKRNLYPLERAIQVAMELFGPNGPKPSAVFCANDETAIGIMKGLRILGLRCPQDVAVMGFDGLELGELLDPRLSTVKQPSFEMAAEGTKLLLDLIEGRVHGPVSKFIPMELVIRDSA